MPIVYIGRLEQKYENLTNKDSASREVGDRRLEQMDNDEDKRQELAKLAYRSMRGVAKLKAIAEEKRRIEEYSKQRQCLFPQTRAKVDKVEPPAVLVSPSPLNVKGKQRADPEGLEPTNSLVAAQTTSHSESNLSTNRPSDTSGRLSVSSTSSPPSIQQDNRSNTQTLPPKPRAKDEHMSMSTRSYRLHSIPPWFIADLACTAYATPAPDLKHVMELGVLHNASVMS